MWDDGSRIKIVVGHYGSGKTEIALNMARAMRQTSAEVALVDLDIVNPFFRSAERGDWLGAHGIRLIAPEFALTAVDIPTLPAEIRSVFAHAGLRVVFDVGGDDAGATALGQFRAQFEREGYDMLYVINPFRPRSGTVQEIEAMIDRVSHTARLRPTGLINNANLGGDSTPRELDVGAAVLKEVSARRNLPVVAVCGTADVLDGYQTDVPKFTIERLMKPEWMER